MVRRLHIKVRGLDPPEHQLIRPCTWLKFTLKYHAWFEIRNSKFEIMNRPGDPVLAKFRSLRPAEKALLSLITIFLIIIFAWISLKIFDPEDILDLLQNARPKLVKDAMAVVVCPSFSGYMKCTPTKSLRHVGFPPCRTAPISTRREPHGRSWTIWDRSRPDTTIAREPGQISTWLRPNLSLWVGRLVCDTDDILTPTSTSTTLTSTTHCGGQSLAVWPPDWEGI